MSIPEVTSAEICKKKKKRKSTPNCSSNENEAIPKYEHYSKMNQKKEKIKDEKLSDNDPTKYPKEVKKNKKNYEKSNISCADENDSIMSQTTIQKKKKKKKRKRELEEDNDNDNKSLQIEQDKDEEESMSTKKKKKNKKRKNEENNPLNLLEHSSKALKLEYKNEESVGQKKKKKKHNITHVDEISNDVCIQVRDKITQNCELDQDDNCVDVIIPENKSSKKKKKKKKCRNALLAVTDNSSSKQIQINGSSGSVEEQERDEINNENKVSKKKSKKKKKCTDLDDTCISHVEQQESMSHEEEKKKKKKKRKHEDYTGTDSSTPSCTQDTTPRVELFKDAVFESEKRKEQFSRVVHGKSADADKNFVKKRKIENSDLVETSTPSLTPTVLRGQWKGAMFENQERQNKFLRLLGGVKHSGSDKKSPFSQPKLNASSTMDTKKKGLYGSLFNSPKTLENALEKNDGRSKALSVGAAAEMNKRLEDDYNKALNFKLSGSKGAGLGFTPDPSEGKKFHIDANASKSVKFDDDD